MAKNKHQMEVALAPVEGSKKSVRSTSGSEWSLSSKMHDSILGSVNSFMSRTHSHSVDFSYHSDSSEGDENHSITTNPKNWHFAQVKKWLAAKELEVFIPIFQKDHHNHGVDGHRLLELNRDVLMNEHPFDLATTDLPGDDEDHPMTDEQKKTLINHLLMELAKLQTKNDDFKTAKSLDITDFNEIRRRIDLFVVKWERILWIEHYEDAFNGELPSKKKIAEEFGVTPVISLIYLEAFEQMEKQKKQDLKELFEGFNITHDCIIWWKLIISNLKTKPRKSIWIIFEEIALYTPTPVGMSLLDHFKLDLTRFPEDAVDSVCKNLVISSQYPINACLEIGNWMKERAEYDISRTELFEELSENYVNTALEYLDLIESDHFATVILEVKSNIKGMSAFDQALEYELLPFVKNNRIERISNSIMNEYKFLDPKNRSNAFQISPLSLDLYWNKIWTKEFYFTPVGIFATQLLLYTIYLLLFTFLSASQFRVYDDVTLREFIFWVFNIGYVMYEIFSMIDEGLHAYFEQSSNYFDFVISGLFVASFAVRVKVWVVKNYGAGLDCNYSQDASVDNHCSDITENTLFVIMWGINTIMLWTRLTFFMILSTELGPMIRMIQRMMKDIVTFLEIIGIIMIGFIVCLVFVLGDVSDSFSTFPAAFLTMFRAALGDFDFDNFAELGSETNPAFFLFGYIIISIYLIISAIVLLNLLIAMMAKTFDSINETTLSQIVFARFELALELNRASAFMPPPFNVFAMLFMILFYLIEFIINHTLYLCSKSHFDLAVFIMPNWMKYCKLELDDQIKGHRVHVLTSEGDSIGKITDFDEDVHHHEITFYTDETEKEKKNVIIGDHVLKKNKWSVDIFDLSREHYLKLDQFSDKLTSAMTQHHNEDAKKERKAHHESHHWICHFCRMYVKESKISIKRLGRELNVNDRDLNLLAGIDPAICPNCYRTRHETQRWRFVWEIISIYIYYFMVFPILLLLLSMAMMCNCLMNPHEITHHMQVCRSKCHHYWHQISCCKSQRTIASRYDANTRAALKAMHAADVHHEDSDDDSSSSDEDDEMDTEHMTLKQVKRLKAKKKHRKKDYVVGHYDSHELVHTLHHLGKEEDELFDHSLSSEIWHNLYDAKASIDLYIMKERVSEHIISLSSEDEITELDFYIDFVEMEDLNHNITTWEMLFRPFAKAIFQHIHDSREMELPLHLFAKYPMAPSMVLDDFEHWHHSTNPSDMKINECTSSDIVNFLEEYGSLRCKSREELRSLLDHITESDEYKHDHHTEYDQFVAYLKEVRSLFTETKKLKNLIRDAGIAIVERGADHQIIREEMDLLFEEIPTSLVALPFFRAMKQETDIIKLWTVRNFLKVIYLLRSLVKEKMLDFNPHIYVTKKQLIRAVFDKFKNKIVDKRHIMDQYASKKEKMKKEKIAKSKFLDKPMAMIRTVSDEDETKSSTEESDEEEEEWKGHQFDHSLECNLDQSDEDKAPKDIDEEDTIRRQEQKRFNLKKARRAHSSDESDHDHDKREAKRLAKKKQLHRNQQRLKLLHTNRVTASTIAKVVGFIFDQIRYGRSKKAKITASTMEHYQHKMNIAFRNKYALHFVYSQLCRYVIFHPKSLKEQCTADKLKEILETQKYDHTHIIDVQSRPNYGNPQNIYGQIELIYKLSKKEKKDVDEDENDKKFMTIEDALSIMLLYYRIFGNLEQTINARADEFVVTRPVFQKFCDRENFRPGLHREKWSKTAKEASNLFQSVLDTEQNYVTLGEIRQTIIHLIVNADDMRAGHLHRLRNYLIARVQKDEDRRISKYPKYQRRLAKWQKLNAKNAAGKIKKPKSPKLAYKHLDLSTFADFIKKISDEYVPRIDGHAIVTNHTKDTDVCVLSQNDDDENMEHPEDMFCRIASVAICTVEDADKFDVIEEEKEMDEVDETQKEKESDIGDQMQSDIEKMKQSLKQLSDGTAGGGTGDDAKTDENEENEADEDEDDNEEEQEEKEQKSGHKYKDAVDSKKMNRKYKIVYDSILKKFEHRITLQQLMQFLRSFKRWLTSNEALGALFERYEAAEKNHEDEDAVFHLEEAMKKKKIGSYAAFFAKYFGNQAYGKKKFTKEQYLRHIKKRDREIRWIFNQCHKEYDLFYLIEPFFEGKIIHEIEELLESSDDIEGNYELRSEEFAQLKTQLHVNGHAAVQLFHIMRAHQQSLSWKQLCSYFVFLEKIKIVIDDCIRRSPKGEDTDLSIDKMKLELHIASQDEANWLFETVEEHHCQKVSWKHFRKYLNKSLMVRQEVRDFFIEQESAKEYQENAYVLVNKLQKSIDKLQPNAQK